MKPTPVRLEPHQKVKAETRASKAGISVAQYIRNLIDNDK